MNLRHKRIGLGVAMHILSAYLVQLNNSAIFLFQPTFFLFDIGYLLMLLLARWLAGWLRLQWDRPYAHALLCW